MQLQKSWQHGKKQNHIHHIVSITHFFVCKSDVLVKVLDDGMVDSAQPIF